MDPTEAGDPAASRFLFDPSRGGFLLSDWRKASAGRRICTQCLCLFVSCCTHVERAALSPSLPCRAVCTTVRPDSLQEQEEPIKRQTCEDTAAALRRSHRFLLFHGHVENYTSFLKTIKAVCPSRTL